MELMSSLLLCALVAFLPQALGQSRRKFSYDNGYNNSLLIKRKMNTIGKNILLNKNTPSLAGKLNDLQSIFIDPTCRGCYICIERAMNAHKIHTNRLDQHISSESFQNNRNAIEVSRREKRRALPETARGKKSKSAKSKKSKGVTVMKYTDEGKIYALKIKETNSALDLHNKSQTVTICQVYSVQKSFSCDSSEANLILTDSRKKNNKKGKKGLGKRETKRADPIKAVTVPVIPWKGYIDDAYVLEQIMPSIEEMY